MIEDDIGLGNIRGLGSLRRKAVVKPKRERKLRRFRKNLTKVKQEVGSKMKRTIFKIDDAVFEKFESFKAKRDEKRAIALEKKAKDKKAKLKKDMLGFSASNRQIETYQGGFL